MKNQNPEAQDEDEIRNPSSPADNVQDQVESRSPSAAPPLPASPPAPVDEEPNEEMNEALLSDDQATFIILVSFVSFALAVVITRYHQLWDNPWLILVKGRMFTYGFTLPLMCFFFNQKLWSHCKKLLCDIFRPTNNVIDVIE